MTIPKYHELGFWSEEKNATKITGSFTLTGAGVVAVKAGAGFTVAYTAAGRYLVTITGTHWSQIVSVKATVETALHNVDQYAQIEAIACVLGTAPTIALRSKNNAAASELAVGDDMHFEATLLSGGVDA